MNRRSLSAKMAFGLLVFASLSSRNAWGFPNLNTQDIYILEHSDGDPAFMHVRHELQLAEESWFPGRVMYSTSLLFKIIGGAHEGQYVAVISRWRQSIEEQMAANGLASVVARPVLNPTATFDERSDLGVGGMTVLRRRGDNRFEP